MASLVTDNNNNVGKCSLTKPSWPRRKGNDKVYVQRYLTQNRNFTLRSNILNKLTDYKDMVHSINNSINKELKELSKIEDKMQKDGVFKTGIRR